MKRVRYPFIVRYTPQLIGDVTFARELPDDDFERTGDQLLATVYTDLKMFRKGFKKSPTAYVKHHNTSPFKHTHVDLIYVGL